MVIPPYLKKGDKVALVAPARKMSAAELEPAIQTIGQWGFEPVLAPNVYGSYNQFSGTDEERCADMQWALDNPDIKAVIAIRGGYGCLRIVDALNLVSFTRHPKWVVGYSDITAFHSAIHTKTNVCTLHATMPVNFDKHEKATKSLYNALTGQGNTYHFADETLRPANSDGVLVGGNLSLLYAMIGTPTDIDTNGKILFIEDLDEYLYHIDRMMLTLKRAGKLANLKALVVGSFTEMKDNTIAFGKNAREIICDAVKEYTYPVYFNFPAGHQDANKAMVFGAECTLEITGGEVVFYQ
ncbi:MAG TPA: LD-carboxypeptidase [Flavobacteriales bacterium]|nr:LD-carboxypeptidase [Flavobacteriales bacterium]